MRTWERFQVRTPKDDFFCSRTLQTFPHSGPKNRPSKGKALVQIAMDPDFHRKIRRAEAQNGGATPPGHLRRTARIRTGSFSVALSSGPRRPSRFLETRRDRRNDAAPTC